MASGQLNSNSKPIIRNNFIGFTIKKVDNRTTATVFSLLVIAYLCGLLPTGNCANDEKISQNSVIDLLQSELLEKPVEILPEPNSTDQHNELIRNNSNEARSEKKDPPEPLTEKTPESTTPKQSQPESNKTPTGQRETVVKSKFPERAQLGVKIVTPTQPVEKRTRVVKQNQTGLAETDREIPIQRQQSNLKNLLKKKVLCPATSLVHYNVTFVPIWSSKRFPKMYPTYRPNAQWSKTIGRTHDHTYNMWQLDTFASPAVKSFAEEGFAADFDTESQGENGIYDVFTLPAIYKGVGDSRGGIFLDGMHPLVSLMVKIIPSPDWFVGISGLNLCSKGKWRRKAVFKLFPVDAGTDKGMTFTSPNWPSYPPEKIYRITSSHPSHDANSFYYPKLKKLPRIGYVIFHKTTEGKTVFKRRKPYKINLSGVSNQLPPVDVIRKEVDNPNGSQKPTTLVQSDQRPIAKKPQTASVVSNQNERQPRTSLRLAIIDVGPGPALDCQVSNWGHWSACSKTCGFGRRERHRFVTQQKKNQGLICPKLKEEELCGSMRNCKWSHFQPFRWQTLRTQKRH